MTSFSFCEEWGQHKRRAALKTFTDALAGPDLEGDISPRGTRELNKLATLIEWKGYIHGLQRAQCPAAPREFSIILTPSLPARFLGEFLLLFVRGRTALTQTRPVRQGPIYPRRLYRASRRNSVHGDHMTEWRKDSLRFWIKRDCISANWGNLQAVFYGGSYNPVLSAQCISRQSEQASGPP